MIKFFRRKQVKVKSITEMLSNALDSQHVQDQIAAFDDCKKGTYFKPSPKNWKYTLISRGK